MDFAWLAPTITAVTQTAAAGMQLGGTINTNKTNQAIANAQVTGATTQNKDNNATAVELARQAAQQQQRLLNYEYERQKLGQLGAMPWIWLIGGCFFLGLLGFIGYKAFR